MHVLQSRSGRGGEAKRKSLPYYAENCMVGNTFPNSNNCCYCHHHHSCWLS